MQFRRDLKTYIYEIKLITMKFKHLLIIGAALLVAACGINKKAYHASSKMAVVSINSIEKIKNNATIQSRLMTEVRKIDTNLTNPATMVHDEFYGLKLDRLMSKLAPEKEIVDYPNFKKFAANNDNNLKGLDQFSNLGVKYIAYEGYPVIKTSQKETIMAAFNSLPEDVDAVLVLSNHFSFQEDMNVSVGGMSTAGLHKQRVLSQLTVYMLTREGKKILHKVFTGTSEDKLGSNSDEPGPTLDEVARQALGESMREFQNYLHKKVGG